MLGLCPRKSELFFRDQRGVVSPRHLCVNGVSDLGHPEIGQTSGGLDTLVVVTIAVAPQQALSASLVMVAAQELDHFEFNRLLEQELSAQAADLRERCVSSGRTEEPFFQELAGGVEVSWLSSASVRSFLFVGSSALIPQWRDFLPIPHSRDDSAVASV